jgi:tetratricopeptide (TPR) repeat protein
MTPGKFTISDGALLLTVLLGLACVVGLSSWIDAHRPAVDLAVEEEKLYVSAATLKRASLGFNGLAADWYWMRSLQYVGGKIVKLPAHGQVNHLGQLNLKLLGPLLDAATTLDPQFIQAYQYAALVLPDVDVQEAIRIVKKGIVANPSEWRLHGNLGYIYWQQKDFQTARGAYEQGSQIPGAPPWMKAMSARMANEGGSRNTARAIYQQMYEDTTDEKIKAMAGKRLEHLNALDQQDALRRLLVTYKSKTGRCPGTWRSVEPLLRSLRVPVDPSGAPMDPTGVPYRLVPEKCDVGFGQMSEMAFW